MATRSRSPSPRAPDRTDQESRSEGTGPRVDSSCRTDKDAQQPAKEGTMGARKSKGFTDEERAAMRERAKELKAEERANRNRAAGERAVLAKIAEMEGQLVWCVQRKTSY